MTTHARIRAARLLAAIRAEGGDWPTSRANTLYRGLGAPNGRVYRLRGGRAAA